MVFTMIARWFMLIVSQQARRGVTNQYHHAMGCRCLCDELAMEQPVLMSEDRWTR